jgi:hypothetical protein
MHGEFLQGERRTLDVSGDELFALFVGVPHPYAKAVVILQ